MRRLRQRDAGRLPVDSEQAGSDQKKAGIQQEGRVFQFGSDAIASALEI